MESAPKGSSHRWPSKWSLDSTRTPEQPLTYSRHPKQQFPHGMDRTPFKVENEAVKSSANLHSPGVLCHDGPQAILGRNFLKPFSNSGQSVSQTRSNGRMVKRQRLSPDLASQAFDSTNLDARDHPIKTEFDVPDSDDENTKDHRRGVLTPLNRSPAVLRPQRLDKKTMIVKPTSRSRDMSRPHHKSRADKERYDSAASAGSDGTTNGPIKELRKAVPPTAETPAGIGCITSVQVIGRDKDVETTPNIVPRRHGTTKFSSKATSVTKEPIKMPQILPTLNSSRRERSISANWSEPYGPSIGDTSDSTMTTSTLETNHSANSAPTVERALFLDTVASGEALSIVPVKKRKLKDRLVESSRSLDGFGDPNNEREESYVNNLRSELSSCTEGSSIKGRSVHPHSGLLRSAEMTNMTIQGTQRGRTTYGGQRSYLSEQVEDQDSLLDTQMSDLVATTPHVRRVLDVFQSQPIRASSTMERFYDFNDDEEQEKSLRTVHELRAAGQMRRSALESDALIDDILQADTTSQRRGAIFRLTQRLFDQKFRDNFVRNGLHDRFQTISSSESDQFGDAAIHMSAYGILKTASATDLTSVKLGKRLVRSCREALGSKQSLLSMARDRRANLSKVHRADLNELCSKFVEQESQDRLDISQLTGRFLALKCLAIITNQLGQSTYVHHAIGDSFFSTLISIAASSADRNAELSADTDDLTLSLSILEAVSTQKLLGNNGRDDLTPAAAQAMGQILINMISTDLEKRQTRVYLALRVCLNVTTSSPVSAENLAQPKLIEMVTRLVTDGYKDLEAGVQLDQLESKIDRLILCLGFLTNLTERTDRNRQLFLGANSYNLTCLDSLLEIFEKRHKAAATATTESESRINVTFGYVVILICCLCLNSEIRQRVGQALGDPQLVKVRGDMAQFVIFNRSIATGLNDNPDAETSQQGLFVDRMEHVLKALTAACKNELGLGNER